MAERIKKAKPNHMLPTRLTSALRTRRGSKQRDGKRYSTQMETKREQGFYLEKTHFSSKAVTRDKGHCLIIKEPIHQEDIKIVNYMYLTLEHLSV